MIRFADKAAPKSGTRSPGHVHKFAVGAKTLHQATGRPETDVFSVIRQMPESTTGFHYRIKSDADGHERVVAEAEMKVAEKKAP